MRRSASSSTSAVFDRVRTCDNHCPFCFIHQLPKGMRKSLYLKDDDYRLSFLYGNFTTLTRFTEADLERVVSERLGRCTSASTRPIPTCAPGSCATGAGATSLRWLELLLDAGIEVHGQVVVCPGINDGAVLDDTLLGVLDRFPRARDRRRGAARRERAQPRRRDARAHARPRRRPWSTSSSGGRSASSARSAAGSCTSPTSTTSSRSARSRRSPRTTACAQHENGIGMARTFEAEVRAALAGDDVAGTGPRSGFFAWVDGAPADGYRAPPATGALPPTPASTRRSCTPTVGT